MYLRFHSSLCNPSKYPTTNCHVKFSFHKKYVFFNMNIVEIKISLEKKKKKKKKKGILGKWVLNNYHIFGGC